MAKPAEHDYTSSKRQIDNDCKTGTFRSCYLLYGAEEYLIRDALSKLKSALTKPGDEMNLYVRHDDAIDVEEAVAFAQTMPFFADRRVVILTDRAHFHKTGADLAAYLKTPAEDAVFVLVAYGFTAQDKRGLSDFQRSALHKAAASAGRVLHCAVQSDEVLKLWVYKRLAKDHGKIFQEKTLDAFLARMNGNMSHIATETDKLISYTEGRKEITVKDIDAICTPWLEGRIFDLTDALANRNRQKAMACYMTLLEMDETHTGILYRILQEIYNILMVQEMQRAHLGQEAMIRALKLSKAREWTIKNYLRWSRSFPESELRAIMELILSVDREVKRSLLDRSIAVETVIARTCAQQTTGRT